MKVKVVYMSFEKFIFAVELKIVHTVVHIESYVVKSPPQACPDGGPLPC